MVLSNVTGGTLELAWALGWSILFTFAVLIGWWGAKRIFRTVHNKDNGGE